MDDIDSANQNTSDKSEWDFVRNYEHIFVIELSDKEKEKIGSLDWTDPNSTGLLWLENKDEIVRNEYVDIQDRNDCICHLSRPCLIQ